MKEIFAKHNQRALVCCCWEFEQVSNYYLLLFRSNLKMENAILILVVDGAHSLIMQQNITGQ